MASFNGTSGSDTYTGTAGADTIKGNGGIDRLNGEAGDDSISGGDDGDILHGGDGKDTVRGDEGNDRLYGEGGRDSLYGGGGHDEFFIEALQDIVAGESYDGGDGTDTLVLNLVGDVDISGLVLTSVERITTISAVNHLSMTAAQLNSVNSLATTALILTTSGTVTVAPENVVGAGQVYLNAGGNTISGLRGAIHGSDVADVVTGPSWIHGNGGDDTLTGSSDGDELWGDDGNDVLAGGDGGDILAGGAGDDTIRGGADSDYLDGGQGRDMLFGDAGSDTFTIYTATDIVAGETYNGGDGHDVLSFLGEGETEVDISSATLVDIEEIRLVYGYNVTLAVAQLDGVTKLSANSMTLTTAGTVAWDSLVEAHVGTVILSDLGNTLDVRGNKVLNLRVEGGASADRVLAGVYDVWVWGNGGNDVLIGGQFGDGLAGGEGNDQLTGGGSSDILDGGEDDDALDGGAGADIMHGGAGNDVYFVDNAGDDLVELAGEGIDRVNAAIDFTLGDNVENLALRGAAIVGTGNGLDNAMLGSSGKNTLTGLAGADTIDGGTGFDTLDGGAGDDLLTGGVGKDRLTGGAGLDQFVFRDGDLVVDRILTDVVTDFSHAQGDRLKLSPMDANTALAGDQKFAFIGAGAFTGVAGQLHFVQDAGITYVEGDTNGDGMADFSIRLNGVINLVGADFVL